MRRLESLLQNTVAKHPESVAIVDASGKWTYTELYALATRMAHALAALGAGKGDRIGIWQEKSAKSIAAMHAALMLEAVYVPLDPLNPLQRITTIIADCDMAALVTTEKKARSLREESIIQPMLIIDELSQTIPDTLSWNDILQQPETLPDSVKDAQAHSTDELAYILYTSGSTGTPKGVCISHENSRAFIDWAFNETSPDHTDRFANHAPFHFDLSVFDIYVCIAAGGSLYLISEMISYLQGGLVDFVKKNQITVWYSVPSALMMMMDADDRFNQNNTALKTLVFAGEPFPVPNLRQLRERFENADLYNFYGPTETNVCTFYKVDQTIPDKLPIGIACSEDTVSVCNEQGNPVSRGEKGELFVEGKTVFRQYWGKPPREMPAYGTGDIVYQTEDGNLVYVGRRDNMLKVRGYRIECGDIEATLNNLEHIKQAAVIITGKGSDARIRACLVLEPGHTCTLLDVKSHCMKYLPRYMIVDDIEFFDELPRNANGKVDRLKLNQLAAQV